MYYGTWCQHLGIQLFRERLSEKLCTRQSRKVIWDMINTLFLTTVAVEPTFVAFLLHSQTTFPWPFVPILSNFFEKKRTQNHPQCLSGLSRTFPDNLSRNSCILHAFPWPGNFECPTYVFGPFIPFFLLNWWPSSLENAIFFLWSCYGA